MRYITKDGVEKSFESIGECIAAIGSGALTGDSMVYDSSGGRWIKAREHPDFAPLLGTSSAKPPESTGPYRLRIAAWCVWIIGLGGPPVIAALQGADAPYVFGQAVGTALFFALIGGVALFFVKNRVKLGLVLGLLVCVTDIGLVNQLVDNQTARARLHESARNLQNSLSSRPTSSPENSAPNASTPAATGSSNSTDAASRMLDLTAGLVSDEKRLGEEFQHETALLQPETMLAPSTLLSEAGLRDGLRRINAWSTYLDTYERSVDRLGSDFEAKILALSLTDAQRSSFDSDFKAGWAEAREKLGRFLTVERKLIIEIHAFYAFMGDRVGLVNVVNNKLIFPTSADADTYARHFQRVKELGAQEGQALKEMQQMYQQGMTKLEAVARQAASE